jgi:spermidine/putrescine transport system substrate-binding protein
MEASNEVRDEQRYESTVFLRTTGAAAAACAAGSLFPTRALAGDRSDEFNILCWEGYNTENVLGPFRKKFKGVKVKAESSTDDPSMINKLRAGELKVWDLINLNQCWAATSCGRRS